MASLHLLTYCHSSAERRHLPCAEFHTGHTHLVFFPYHDILQCDGPIAPNSHFVKAEFIHTLVKHIKMEVTALPLNLNRLTLTT